MNCIPGCVCCVLLCVLCVFCNEGRNGLASWALIVELVNLKYWVNEILRYNVSRNILTFYSTTFI